MFLRAYLFVFDFGYFELSQFTSFRIRVMEMGKGDDFPPFHLLFMKIDQFGFLLTFV